MNKYLIHIQHLKLLKLDIVLSLHNTVSLKMKRYNNTACEACMSMKVLTVTVSEPSECIMLQLLMM